MIAQIIQWSIRNRFLVLLATVLLVFLGLRALRDTPVDAIPDLSDVQVIVKTSFPGQAPQVVQDQVTYPLTTAMLSVPGAKTVRGFSFFGDSYIYVIFDDDTDLYWARSRVLEYLSQVSGMLPPGVSPQLGPDATGVGWVYMYALTDRSGQHDLSELRSLQDWFLRYELQTVPGVAEIATIGGMVRQYQVVVEPDRLRTHGIPLAHVRQAIQRANQESGGSVVEMAEAEYMIRAMGYIGSLEDIRQIPLGMNRAGTPVFLGEIATVRLGPQMRRGIAELNGEGEVVGGVVVMRFGENAERTIRAVKAKLSELRDSLPEGVEIVETYDRSQLIGRAISNLRGKLIEEFIVVSIICALFLFHLRSALVIVLSLPVGILGAIIIMQMQGMNANIMSLGGIAIAIGTMVDGAIVMIENVHKHLQDTNAKGDARWDAIGRAASEVGAPLFFSLLIITMSFMPVFTLQAQEGKLFSPLAYTKTYAMAAAAILAITLVPVLIGYLVRGRIISEERNPLSRAMRAAYHPVISGVASHPGKIVALGALLTVIGMWPVTQLGSEFMPPLDEGDLLYMPSAYPGISIGKARELLQQTDKLIRTVPEVETVFGKIGKAETATDPAPLTMIETLIRLKPRDQWRPGMTTEKLVAELDAKIQFPGLTNTWVMPIRNRIDMLATGIKTPVGIKVNGPDLATIQSIGKELEQRMPELAGTSSVYSERVAGARYLLVEPDRTRAARYGLHIQDIHEVVRTAVGGMNVSGVVDGLERYPLNLRYPQHYRDSVQSLRELPIVTPAGAHILLADVASVEVADGPPAIKSENGRLSGWTFVDIEGTDLGSYVESARQFVEAEIDLPPGYSLSWSGQYEYLLRAREHLSIVMPMTVLIILVLLYLNFRNLPEVLIILGTLPFAVLGGLWLTYLLGFNLSVAVGVGFIALAGVSVEIGVLMLVYLDLAYRRTLETAKQQNRQPTAEDLRAAVIEGAGLRLRPIIMTFAATIAGLIPIMRGGSTGAEFMQRIAAPMMGGMISALLLGLVLIPAVYLLWRIAGLKQYPVRN